MWKQTQRSPEEEIDLREGRKLKRNKKKQENKKKQKNKKTKKTKKNKKTKDMPSMPTVSRFFFGLFWSFLFFVYLDLCGLVWYIWAYCGLLWPFDDVKTLQGKQCKMHRRTASFSVSKI
jgi:hypothetical protein